MQANDDWGNLRGADLIRVLAALANPQRLRIIAALADGATYVSQLARQVQLSRPLVHMHLQRLEAARLVAGQLQLSEDGKAMKWYHVNPFTLTLTPEVITELVGTLGEESG